MPDSETPETPPIDRSFAAVATAKPPLAARLRAGTRRTLSAGLQLIPDAAFVPLRRTLPATKPDSWKYRGVRGVLDIARHRGIPADVAQFPVVDHPELVLTRADNWVTECVYWFGERYGYETGGVYWWRHFCGSARRILELGANIGYYTIQGAVAAPAASYLAVEPHPGCAATLRRNLAANGITNVTVVEAAAVPRAGTGTVVLRLPGGKDHYTGAPCTGFVGRNDVHWGDAENPSYQELVVPEIELSQLIEGVELVKLDVEGQEHGLLSSIRDQLVEQRPTLFVELLDTATTLRELLTELSEAAGYRCYVPLPDRLEPLPLDRVRSLDVRNRFNTTDIVLTAGPAPSGAPQAPARR